MSDEILSSIDGRRLGWTKDNALHFKGQGIQEFRGVILEVPDTSYTLQDRDTGSMIRFDSATAVTCNLPKDAPEGFNVMLVQWNTGNVQFVVEDGAALFSRFAGNALGGRYAAGSLIVMQNDDGQSAQWWFGGDGA